MMPSVICVARRCGARRERRKGLEGEEPTKGNGKGERGGELARGWTGTKEKGLFGGGRTVAVAVTVTVTLAFPETLNFKLLLYNTYTFVAHSVMNTVPVPLLPCSPQGCTGRAYGGSSTSGTYGYVAQTYRTSQTFQ
eukprot:364074-Chlamydomonas_euryale.AAC.2